MSPDQRPDQWIVVTGDPVDGLEFIGPFDSHDDALAYAENETGDYADWWIAPLAAGG